jgi:polysaccharide deacetylase family protein (PEP-CTERM system associated)
MIHALTIDVEDYHNVVARDWLGRDGPPTAAVVGNTQRLVDLLGRRGVRATFFVLGEVAAEFPRLMRELVDAGHELGVHGFRHRQVFKLTREEFRSEVADAKSAVQEAAGTEVVGHRAPAFSIVPETRWALDILAQVGFRYDSSIFPFAGRRYGWPGFSPDIHEIDLGDGRSIIEAPMSTVSLLGRRLPACGGGYLRHFPLAFTRWALRRIQSERPAIVYLHPYEIETNATMIDVSALAPGAARRARRFHRIQMRSRGTVEGKITRLLDEFDFAPLGEVIDLALRGVAGGSVPPP